MVKKECINCNPNCFDHTTDGCVEITVGSNDLGITAYEDSLKRALEVIMSEIESIKKSLSQPCDDCNESSSSDLGIVGLNTPSNTLYNIPMKVKVEPKQSSTLVTYDLRDVADSLGSSTNVPKVQAFGTINGRGARLYDSNSLYGSFEASPENFPLNLDVEVTSITGDGQKILKTNKSYLNSQQDSEETLIMTDLSTQSVSTQRDVNSLLEKRLDTVDNKVKEINKLTVNGKQGISEILVDMQSQINDLKNNTV